MKLFLLIIVIALSNNVVSQNFGIGTLTPLEKLDVNGNTRSTGFIITVGGSIYDFVIKNNATGEVGFRKGHGGLGINFLICYEGQVPSNPSNQPSDPNSVQDEWNVIGMIKMNAGFLVPRGWLLCYGQLVPISEYPALYNIIGTTFGGNGTTTFVIPDMRGMAPVCQGTNPAAYSWNRGQKTD